jgi:hypothetical protein
MNLRGLLGTALLLAIPAMARPGVAQAAGAPPAAVQPAAAVQPTRVQPAASADAALPATPSVTSSITQPATLSAIQPSLRVECTPASRASELTGKHGCVAGKVFHITTTKRGDIHLSLCPSRKRGGAECSFHVVARARDSSSVGDLAGLRGKIVAVVGDVTEYRSHPAIVVRDKEQLQIAAGEAPQEFDVTQRRPGGRGIPGARSVPGVRNIPGVGNGRAW